jgi:23S rRNA (uracil1939-C5)-methyltransferase
VIVNPPRRGLSPEVRRSVAQLGPRAVVYMSCDPATLARDLAHFRDLGFATRELWPFDMIPHSDAVECLVVLCRTAAPPPRLVHEDAQLILLDQSGYDQLDTESVRELPGASEAVPLYPTDDGSSGLVAFARNATVLAPLRAALTAGGLTCHALVRGITHKKGRIRRPLQGQRRGAPPCTSYQREAVHAGHSFVSVQPDQANLAQIRQHFASIGHPILGDTRFGDAASNTFFEHRHGLDRGFLHAAQLRLALPSGSLSFESALPGELRAVLESLSEQTATRS